MLEASALQDPTSAWLAARLPAHPRTLFPIILLLATSSWVPCPFCWAAAPVLSVGPGRLQSWLRRSHGNPESTVLKSKVMAKTQNDSWTQTSCLCQEAGSPKSRCSRGAEGDGVRLAGAGVRGSYRLGDPQNSPHGLGDHGGWT